MPKTATPAMVQAQLQQQAAVAIKSNLEEAIRLARQLHAVRQLPEGLQYVGSNHPARKLYLSVMELNRKLTSQSPSDVLASAPAQGRPTREAQQLYRHVIRAWTLEVPELTRLRPQVREEFDNAVWNKLMGDHTVVRAEFLAQKHPQYNADQWRQFVCFFARTIVPTLRNMVAPFVRNWDMVPQI